MDNKEKRFQILKNQLYCCFRFAYQGKLSLDRLYEKGLEICEGFDSLEIDFEGERLNDLSEALLFIEELHDSETRKYVSKNREELYYQMRRIEEMNC